MRATFETKSCTDIEKTTTGTANRNSLSWSEHFIDMLPLFLQTGLFSRIYQSVGWSVYQKCHMLLSGLPEINGQSLKNLIFNIQMIFFPHFCIICFDYMPR